jgi:dienelactone hydrolase
MKFWLGLALCALALAPPAQAVVSLEDFARTDSYDDASISPDGHYLALRVPLGQQYGLAVIDLNSRKLLSKISAGADRSVVDYDWASSDRLVFGIGENYGFATRPVATGEVIAIDVDGKGARAIFSWRGETVAIGTRLGRDIRKNAFGYLIRTLPKDPEHVLVASYDFNDNADRVRGTALRVHTRSGARDEAVVSPIAGWVHFAADNDGFIRYLVGSDDHSLSVTYVRTPEKPEWRQLKSAGRAHANVRPLGFSSDNRYVWLSTDEDSERACLVREDLESGERSKISCDDVSDLRSAVFNAARDTPLAAYYEGGMPRLRILPGDGPAARMMRILQKTFPGQIALPVSQTDNGRYAIVEVYSDRNPGDYYFVDTQTLKADYVAGRRGWLDPEQMAERRPIVITARDGTPLHGFLTLPQGRPEKNLPLVVNPHGGPFGIEDAWAWALDPQLLASRGYAVLQVNFRGSGGFGESFETAGKQSWDKLMVDDVTDAARWVIGQGFADENRVCIYGASYGGYSAMMSAQREPGLYRCVIGYAGVYDLPLLARDSDIVATTRGENYLSEFVGATPERLADASPVSHVDRLKAAVMIVHGTQDKRAPFSQAKSLRRALEDRQYPFEWMEVAGEGHGFYAPENRKAFYDKLLAFLDKNIGVAAPIQVP